MPEYRAGVMDALRKDGHVVVDSHEATAEPTLAQCVADVNGCELYVGLFAWRYGWRRPATSSATPSSAWDENSHVMKGGSYLNDLR